MQTVIDGTAIGDTNVPLETPATDVTVSCSVVSSPQSVITIIPTQDGATPVCSTPDEFGQVNCTLTETIEGVKNEATIGCEYQYTPPDPPGGEAVDFTRSAKITNGNSAGML